MPGRLDALWYGTAHFVCSTAFTLGWSLRVSGRNNLPPTGPVLLLANHLSFLDPPLIGAAANRPLWYLARKSLWKGLFGKLLTSLHGIPLEHEGLGKEGLTVSLEQLKAGRPVLLFPEGTRSPDGQFHGLKPGLLLLVKRTHAPIVPVGLAGAFAAWPKGQTLPGVAPLFLPPSPANLAVAFGRPIDPAAVTELPREAALAVLHDAIAGCVRRAEAIQRKK